MAAAAPGSEKPAWHSAQASLGPTPPRRRRSGCPSRLQWGTLLVSHAYPCLC
ncbi:hypothetical protein Taro_027547, partial [Colocasia esculenta]|nr:hypothetical protein [Colocasia esculenta]